MLWLSMVVYENYDYEDALIELKDILEAEDFCIVSAGAFIAQHSIFSSDRSRQT